MRASHTLVAFCDAWGTLFVSVGIRTGTYVSCILAWMRRCRNFERPAR